MEGRSSSRSACAWGSALDSHSYLPRQGRSAEDLGTRGRHQRLPYLGAARQAASEPTRPARISSGCSSPEEEHSGNEADQRAEGVVVGPGAVRRRHADRRAADAFLASVKGVGFADTSPRCATAYHDATPLTAGSPTLRPTSPDLPSSIRGLALQTSPRLGTSSQRDVVYDTDTALVLRLRHQI
jgi:hypothetical protein